MVSRAERGFARVAEMDGIVCISVFEDSARNLLVKIFIFHHESRVTGWTGLLKKRNDRHCVRFLGFYKICTRIPADYLKAVRSGSIGRSEI